MQQAQNQMNQNQQQQESVSKSESEQEQEQQKPSDSSSEQDKEEVPDEEQKNETDPSDGTGVGEVNGTVWDPFNGGSSSVEDYLNNNSGHVNNQTDNSKADDELSPEEQEFINNYLENLQGWGSGLKK
jgi:hypothetical protein